MKKFAGMNGAYRMLGREGENKNCLFGWVWVHLEMASSRTGALVAAGSIQPTQTPMRAELGFIYMGFLQLMVHWWVTLAPKGKMII
jgi:hypothetical protein